MSFTDMPLCWDRSSEPARRPSAFAGVQLSIFEVEGVEEPGNSGYLPWAEIPGAAWGTKPTLAAVLEASAGKEDGTPE